jgi:predicted nucleic acid-binding Zn ribbon protein
MPTYDYFCEDNQQTVSVAHGMRERLWTWGEVCAWGVMIDSRPIA